MKSSTRCICFALLSVILSRAPALAADGITRLDPPEKAFFSKVLYFQGIPIKSSEVVSNDALFAARDRLAMMLGHLPVVCSNLCDRHAELHIIGRDQVTSDLPEWRFDKGKSLPEYNGLTIDQRTRGMGGRIASCGEENLLQLPNDRYAGRDICVHEFAHCIYQFGLTRDLRNRFRAVYKSSLAKGLWQKAYAGSNDDEFFAELCMWYFGTHGDLHMTDPKPANGPDGLKAYDPDAFGLFDDLFSGRLPTPRVSHPGAAKSDDGESSMNNVSPFSIRDRAADVLRDQICCVPRLVSVTIAGVFQ